MKTELIPVIHMLNEEQVFANVETCRNSGVEKVFLINHRVTKTELLECANKVKESRMWVGVNMLGTQAKYAIQSDWDLNALWCDDSLTIDDANSNIFQGITFIGLAFKFQPQPTDLKEACDIARITSDVATTSGISTGVAAPVEKILQIREYLEDHPLAIASGVSKDNVHLYKGLANYLLVATSITDKNEMIVKDKLDELLELL